MTKIQYENLTIRQAEVADAKQLAAWWNDGAVIGTISSLFCCR